MAIAYSADSIAFGAIRYRYCAPCDHHCAPTLPRPPHPLPRFVTIAISASCREGWANLYR